MLVVTQSTYVHVPINTLISYLLNGALNFVLEFREIGLENKKEEVRKRESTDK